MPERDGAEYFRRAGVGRGGTSLGRSDEHVPARPLGRRSRRTAAQRRPRRLRRGGALRSTSSQTRTCPWRRRRVRRGRAVTQSSRATTLRRSPNAQGAEAAGLGLQDRRRQPRQRLMATPGMDAVLFDAPPWVWAAARTLGRPGCCHHVGVRRRPSARCSSPFSCRAATRTTGRTRRHPATVRARRRRARRPSRPRRPTETGPGRADAAGRGRGATQRRAPRRSSTSTGTSSTMRPQTGDVDLLSRRRLEPAWTAAEAASTAIETVYDRGGRIVGGEYAGRLEPIRSYAADGATGRVARRASSGHAEVGRSRGVSIGSIPAVAKWLARSLRIEGGSWRVTHLDVL